MSWDIFNELLKGFSISIVCTGIGSSLIIFNERISKHGYLHKISLFDFNKKRQLFFVTNKELWPTRIVFYAIGSVFLIFGLLDLIATFYEILK